MHLISHAAASATATSPASVFAAPASLLLQQLRGGGGGAVGPAAVVAAATGALSSLARTYSSALATRPLATNIVTSAALSVLSDGIAQQLDFSNNDTSSAKSNWDVARTMWMIAYGALVSGYALYYWFGFLGRLFPTARSDPLALVQKLVVNQLVLSPLLSSLFFFFCIWTRVPPIAQVISKAKWTLFLDKLSKDLWPTLMRGNVFWTSAQLINFKIVPSEYSVVWTNLCFILWTTYLCRVANNHSRKNNN